jgi:multidrug efflux pump subunit AcrB
VNRIIAWFVHNPVAANLLMLTLVAGGFVALPAMHQEEFPSIETDLVRVNVAYPGATPSEVEESVCIRVEEAIDGTPDVDRVSSVSAEGMCVVTIELVMGDGADDALAEVQNRVDAIDTFPDQAEQPIVSKFLITNRVIQIAVSGDVSETTLKVLGQNARDEIAALPGVSQVRLDYTRPYEVSIEVSEETLRRHGAVP